MIATQSRQIDTEIALSGLLETIVETIQKKTPHPEIVHLPNRALFTLKVNPHDQGRFIGKSGKTIWAIQTVLWYAGLTYCLNPYQVKLLEPDEPFKNSTPVPIKFTKSWDRKKIENFIARVLGTTLKSYARYAILETGDTSMTISLTIEKYLALPLSEPNYVEAFETLLKAAGFAQGVAIKTEAQWM